MYCGRRPVSLPRWVGQLYTRLDDGHSPDRHDRMGLSLLRLMDPVSHRTLLKKPRRTSIIKRCPRLLFPTSLSSVSVLSVPSLSFTNLLSLLYYLLSTSVTNYRRLLNDPHQKFGREWVYKVSSGSV